MSQAELRGYAVAGVLTAVGFIWGGPVIGCVILFLSVVLLAWSACMHDESESLPSLINVVPSSLEKPLNPLEIAQLEQLQLDRLIKSLAEHIILWTANQKRILGKSNVVFSEEMLRNEVRDNADRLHIVMNYLIEKGRAKPETPGYWSIN